MEIYTDTHDTSKHQKERKKRKFAQPVSDILLYPVSNSTLCDTQRGYTQDPHPKEEELALAT